MRHLLNKSLLLVGTRLAPAFIRNGFHSFGELLGFSLSLLFIGLLLEELLLQFELVLKNTDGSLGRLCDELNVFYFFFRRVVSQLLSNFGLDLRHYAGWTPTLARTRTHASAQLDPRDSLR